MKAHELINKAIDETIKEYNRAERANLKNYLQGVQEGLSTALACLRLGEATLTSGTSPHHKMIEDAGHHSGDEPYNLNYFHHVQSSYETPVEVMWAIHDPEEIRIVIEDKEYDLPACWAYELSAMLNEMLCHAPLKEMWVIRSKEWNE